MLDHGSKRVIFQTLLMLLLVVCTPRQPAQPFSVGAILEEARFDSTLDWEAYQDARIGVEGRVSDGVYRIDIEDGGFMWALNDRIEGDVIVEVETQQLSDYSDNAYGVMCRADPSANGNGYYFFISGDGYYTIRRGVGREVSDLIPFTFHDSIRRGKDFNRLRAVCVGDYLALFINSVLVGEVRDDRYRGGVVGLTAAVPDDGDVSVSFDNVLIFTALPG